MMLFGIRRLAAAQASARMLPRSLRTHATQSEKRGHPHGWRGSTELQHVLMRVRPTSPSAFCLADSSCSGLVSISAAFSMSTGLFTRFCMRARPGADSSCAARERRHQSGRPAWCSTRASAGSSTAVAPQTIRLPGFAALGRRAGETSLAPPRADGRRRCRLGARTDAPRQISTPPAAAMLHQSAEQASVVAARPYLLGRRQAAGVPG